MDQKAANAIPVSKKVKKENLSNYRLVSITLVPGKVMEQMCLEAISSHVKDKKVVGNSQK